MGVCINHPSPAVAQKKLKPVTQIKLVKIITNPGLLYTT